MSTPRSPRGIAVFSLRVAPLLALCIWFLTTPAARAAEIPVTGTCTLVDAINAANTDSDAGGNCTVAGSGTDTLVLDTDGVYTLVLNDNTYATEGNNALPVIISSVIISGHNAIIQRDISLDCSGDTAFRLFFVGNAGDLTLQDVTVRHGCLADDDPGAGIYIHDGRLTVQNSQILSNTANGGSGGAINSIGHNAVVTITAQSTIAGNAAHFTGGGISNLWGKVIVQDSDIFSNTANSGGAIHDESGTVTVQNSHILTNAANTDGGGIQSGGGTLTVLDSYILSNIATSNGGGIQSGGSTIIIQDSYILSNTANTGTGGGIYASGILTVQNSHIRGNRAAVNGAGIYEVGGTVIVQDSHILENIANSAGGGIHEQGGTITIQNTRILSNTANTGNGGGIFASGAAVTITHQSIIAGNTANFGGGIHNLGTTTIQDSDILSNSADNGAGGILIGGITTIQNSQIRANTTARFGGGIYNGGITTIEDSHILSNTASRGGGIYNTFGNLTIQDSHILANTAGDGAGIYNFQDIQASTAVTLTASTVAGNAANTSGGGIANLDGALTVLNSRILSNTANSSGGGIANIHDTNNTDPLAVVTITQQSTIAGNTAGTGGGIYNQDRALVVQDSQILSSTASNDSGGGIYNLGGALFVSGSRLLDNRKSKSGFGGALFQTSAATSTIEQSCIVGNDDTAVVYDNGSPITASQNWWGSADGPSGVAPGSGDSVSDNVIYTSPLTTAILNCPTYRPDLALDKTADPTGALRPGQALTYTLRFANRGDTPLKTIVLTDSVPANVQVTSVTSATVGAGVIITQTQGGPDFSWQVSDLDLGNGGVITLTTVVNPALSSDTSLTNTAAISADRDLTPTNNFAQVVQMVELPRVHFDATSYSVSEGDGTATLTVTLDAPQPYQDVTVEYQSSDGTAHEASDYSAVTGTLTIPAGTTHATLSVPILDDNTAEGDEALSLTLDHAAHAILDAPEQATLTILDDDEPEHAAASVALDVQADVELARVGEGIVYHYQVTNSGEITLTALELVDSRLGLIALSQSTLASAATASGVATYTVQTGDLPGPLTTQATVTGMPSVGDPVQDQDAVSVSLIDASFSFSKTIGIQGIEPECTERSEETLPLNTVVVYCYQITNTGDVTLTTHTLTDDHLGLILDNVLLDLAPGASYSTRVTHTLTVSVTNVATWRATYVDSSTPDEITTAAADAIPAQATATAVARVSASTQDQDGDTIPDNVEGAADADNDNVPNFRDSNSDGDPSLDSEEVGDDPFHPRDSNDDGLPDFLDPNQPTALEPDQQPREKWLFLPWVQEE